MWVWLDCILSWIAILNIVPDLKTTQKNIVDDGKYEIQKEHLEDCRSFTANFDKLCKDHEAQIETMNNEDQDHLYNLVFDAVHDIKPNYKQSILAEIEKEDDVEEEEEVEMEELELQEDIYCFTYFKFIYEYNPAVQKDLVIKCAVTFVF